ncbi:hypothetical protein VL20_4824 [Microcystis panniformis FACHB-1757]|uniref:Uncharacterized protein n=1 Tax=Microcystis panniformis FACHB-1757 TaxID=1638788 RepID=A0A0K1S6F4_9CHRO|nr:hypothetical protein VL20_4824 [Microcystis panniformis FACHB-1757]
MGNGEARCSHFSYQLSVISYHSDLSNIVTVITVETQHPIAKSV